MTEINSAVKAVTKKPSPFKPPVPARPKNLVVLNSKNLPKPPENVLTGNVTSFIKGLNLDSQDEITSQNSCDKAVTTAMTPNSDEEDIDGYLEPVSLSFGNVFAGGKNFNRPSTTQKNNCEEKGNVRSSQKQINNLTVNAKERANLGRRLSNEMADFGVKFRRRVLKSVTRRFEDSDDYSDCVIEKADCDDTKQHLPHSHRPLPLPPVKKESEITSMPWYKNVDRKKGEELLKDGVDGYFLVRPSSKEDTFLTLTLWFHNRLYNIPIRKRRDGKYALGTSKANEQCFESIEEMIKNYQSEKLLLYSNGAKAGRTLLTNYPP